MRTALWLSVLAALVVLAGCGHAPSATPPPPQEAAATSIPVSDRLRAHVEKLSAEIGQRSVSSYAGLTRAADYISQQLGAAYEQTGAPGGLRQRGTPVERHQQAGSHGLCQGGGGRP